MGWGSQTEYACPVATSTKAYWPNTLVKALSTAGPLQVRPLYKDSVTPARRPSLGRGSRLPLRLRSRYTVPLMTLVCTSPKLYSTPLAPAAKGIALMTLGVAATVVARPPSEPALVMPLAVPTPPNSGCATCSVTR